MFQLHQRKTSLSLSPNMVECFSSMCSWLPVLPLPQPVYLSLSFRRQDLGCMKFWPVVVSPTFVMDFGIQQRPSKYPLNKWVRKTKKTEREETAREKRLCETLGIQQASNKCSLILKRRIKKEGMNMQEEGSTWLTPSLTYSFYVRWFLSPISSAWSSEISTIIILQTLHASI